MFLGRLSLYFLQAQGFLIFSKFNLHFFKNSFLGFSNSSLLNIKLWVLSYHHLIPLHFIFYKFAVSPMKILNRSSVGEVEQLWRNPLLVLKLFHVLFPISTVTLFSLLSCCSSCWFVCFMALIQICILSENFRKFLKFSVPPKVIIILSWFATWIWP